jgi:transposase
MDANRLNVSVTPTEPLYVGLRRAQSSRIDVAKDKLDLARSDTDAVAVFSNDAAGIDQIVRLMLAARPTTLAIESTGGLERPLMEALLEANLPVALVHPGRVRYFAKGLGILAKTDRIDAGVLVRFAKLAAPRLAEKRSKTEADLRDLTACRRQLVATRTQQSNRRGATVNQAARKSIDAVLAALEKQIAALDKQIRRLIDADDDFRHLDQLLRSVPGVGPALSATLAADLRELGDADRQRVSALAGVAPFPDDSGAVHGKRSIRGGRAQVRNTLYMAALTSMRCNPVIKAFAQRLKSMGKVNKVIIVACMRKLLSLLNAMVRDGLTWNELNVVKNLAMTH